jgi:5-methylcytosine-specific restriction protein A
VAERQAWEGSTRRSRLPANWYTELRPRAKRLNPQQICHKCGLPGGTTLDHKIRGDDNCQRKGEHPADCQCNLDWIHDRQDVAAGRVAVSCHGRKTGAEGAAARQRINRDPEQHPAFG